MVAILEKGEFNSDFHPMVDFIAASPLRIVSLFDIMLVHQGEGSGTPTEPHHTPFPEAETSHSTTSSILLPSIPTAPIPPVTQPDPTPIRQYTRRSRIAQSSALPTIADEHASPVRDVSKWEACPTDSGFIADQDRATIAKSFTLPYDLAPRAQEEEIVSLKEKVKVLEDKEDVAATQSRDDAPIKWRSNNEGKAAAERIRGIDVPTGSGFIPTAGPPATVISTGSEVGPTASLIVTRKKGKEVMVESDTPKKKKLQEQIDAQVARELEEQQEKENMRMNDQIARDAEVARIHTEKELQGMIDSLDKSNETIAKYLQEYQDFALELPLEKRIELISDLKREYYMAVIRSNLGWTVKDFKGMTFEEIEAKFAEVWKHVENFIPMGSKEETERLKRKGLNLEQEQVKKKKLSKEAPEIKTSTKEFIEEKMKEMMQEDLNQLWALVKEYLSIRPAIIEWKLYDLSGVHHLTAKDREIFMLVEKGYPLRKGLALVMISYKLQGEMTVKGRLALLTLEDREEVIGVKSVDDAPIKGRRSNEGEA
nr:hypothetical protein [Tanacetum cinerariifolium]